MKLGKLQATHFRCLYDGQEILFHSITVLIGENDGGKIATLLALSLFYCLIAQYSGLCNPNRIKNLAQAQKPGVTIERLYNTSESCK